MTPDKLATSAVRRAARAAALGLGTVLVLGTVAPATAAPPDSWATTDNPGTAHVLLVLGGIPLLLFGVIWLLTYLPSLIKGQKYDAALAWREDPEWFGGPRQGMEKVPADAEATGDKGGASAHW